MTNDVSITSQDGAPLMTTRSQMDALTLIDEHTDEASEGRARALVHELTAAGAQLWNDDGQLRFRAPKGILGPERIAALRADREAVLAVLTQAAKPEVITPCPQEWYEPFPVTDVQAAYLVGRRSVFAYGGVACHGYGELTYDELDPERMEAAWNQLVGRHGMLRGTVGVDGAQQVSRQVGHYRIDVADLRGRPADQFAAAVQRARAALASKVYDTDQWPLFGLGITRGDAESVLHFSIDFLIADFVSIEVILDELHRLYQDASAQLPTLGLTYRDYRVADQRARSSAPGDREYWLARMDELPPAPDLPIRSKPEPGGFRRVETTLDAAAWEGFAVAARQRGLTPSSAVLAAFTETIGAWCRAARFSVNVTLLNRRPIHPDVDRLVGDFTSMSLLAVDKSAGANFVQRAAAGQAQLWQDLDHRGFSGVEVIRELGRRRGPDAALMPIVFTSAIGLQRSDVAPVPRGRLTYGISQTPQVWIDCQNIERGATLVSNWDVRQGVLPDEIIEAAFAAYARLLERLAHGDGWDDAHPIGLPPAARRRRAAVNDTTVPLPEGLLQDGFFAIAGSDGGRTAVLAGSRAMTYADIAGRAGAVARELASAGLRAGEPVAVVMDKGWEQIVAVLGVLCAGGAYLPVDTTQPAARREIILAKADVRIGLTQPWVTPAPACAVRWICVQDEPGTSAAADERTAAPDDLAYVIYTSGSTGVPKGVMISHRAARNTVDDITRRFAITRDDRVLGLAALGFDLSVYDVFGVLGVGGALVLPDGSRHADPSHWAALIWTHGVTLWNSVPAQMQMLSDYLASAPHVTLPTLRLALLSGDWVPVALPDQLRARIPGLRVISLGGATEASIWSIYYPVGTVASDWTSIPYGRPLANQSWAVLDQFGRPCPDGVTGELYIGGAGLALGYLGDPERTAERFVLDPDTGARWYRTGDLGRYRDDGDIEFQGREDSQIKIRGHRVEVAEVETALAGHPDVDTSAVVVYGPPVARQLAAFVASAHRLSLPPPAVMAGAQDQAASILDGIDRVRYLSYLRRLDDVALASMMGLFAEFGLFEDGARHGADEVLARVRVAPRHHRLVRRWMNFLVRQGLLEVEGDEYGRTDAPGLPSDLIDTWDEIVDLGAGIDDVALVDYFRSNAAELRQLIRGERDPLGLLFPDGQVDLSDDLYGQALFNRWANAVTASAVRDLAAGFTGAPVRMLEIGAGAGGLSEQIQDALSTLGGALDYLYTDVSQFFLNAAAERFAGRPGLRFAVYDLNKDPRVQGLSPNSFDIVVAGDVLHSSQDVTSALARVGDLLAPGGWLVVAEMTRDHAQAMTSLELMVALSEVGGDFADERRGRHQTFLRDEQWQRLLGAAGAHSVQSAPTGDDMLDEIGMRVYAAQFKSDRARVTPGQIAAHLAERLPAHMVPPVIEVLDAMPLTGNGKIDRARLRDLIPARSGPAPAVDEGGSELETSLAGLWSAVLRVDHVGRAQSFFELGGDSLLAAQLTGRVIEEVPAAEGMFFDEVLRLVMDNPTVAVLATALAEREVADAAASDAPGTPVSPLVTLGSANSGVPWVLIQDGTGLLHRYPDLARGLAADAPVLGLSGMAGLSVDDAAPAGTSARLADRYAEALSGRAEVHLVGYGLGAVLAFDVAQRLSETGTAVLSLSLIAPEVPAARIEDETLSDWLFARAVGVNFDLLDLPAAQELAGPLATVSAGRSRCIPDGAMAALSADPDPALAAVGGSFARWAALAVEDRLDAIASAAPSIDPVTLRLARPAFRALVHGLADAAEDGVYADDVMILLPLTAPPAGSLWVDPLAYWTARCLGDVVPVMVAGGAAGCLSPPDVEGVLAVLRGRSGGERR